ncbi:endonuclease/exonuclease/phosphatase family protein [Hyalangium sp.]|uniref:endonuclease/exonuclease/phosphatase family protein n=1 Tax=Hyalangium sp. TaxID=2028555 RepID=UPI002D562767|nr:endonuclease/exonuclease/phosphatase family protein [Hyalangium sp.]HYI00551.1 endonuclease/exonuclease/phosphatase family protein [Hyalangium sp.]
MTLKVMTFNVLFGGQDRFEAILGVLDRTRPDVLVLQECLWWEAGDRLHQVAEVLGVPADASHVHLGTARPRGSGRRYHVALASRRPLRAIHLHNDPRQIGHCLIQSQFDSREPVTFFGTHYDAHHEDPRLVEARYLCDLLDPITFREGLYLLAGDLNSLSRRDPYPPDFAGRVRAAGTDKYGHPPRFSVLETLESFGWVDTLYHRGPPAEWVTARRQNNGVQIDYRTDYILASPRMAERLIGAEVVDVGEASDHHAVLATFREE